MASPAYDYPMALSVMPSYTGMRLPGSDVKNSKSSTCCETMTKAQAKQLVVCVDNDGYAVSLEKRKIYVALRDAAAEKHSMLRIVDESGLPLSEDAVPPDRAAAGGPEGCAGRVRRMEALEINRHCHCERSEAIQRAARKSGIASSLTPLAMTIAPARLAPYLHLRCSHSH